MNATRRRLGITSRKSSTRLPTSSGASNDRPVTLAPGCARDATRPVLTGSFATPKTIGNSRSCLLGRDDCSSRDIDLEPYELIGNRGVALLAPLRPAIFDSDCSAFDP